MSQTSMGVSPPVLPEYERFDTIPEYAQLRPSVRSGDWLSFETGLTRMPFDEVTRALAALSDRDGVDEFLDSARDEHPGSPYARTAFAMRAITRGWEARTGADASAVSEQQFAEFHSWLRIAEQVLLEVCAEHPSFTPAWSARLMTARGLQLGLSEARRRYRRLATETPHDYVAQRQLLTFLLPRWFGSDVEAAEFARAATEAAPDGSNSAGLIAVYHVEKWVELGRGHEADAHLASADVHAELRDAARRSVLHPSHRLGSVGAEVHNSFMMAFWLGGHLSDAEEHVRRLGGRVTEFPWYFAFDTASGLVRVYNEVRAAANGTVPR